MCFELSFLYDFLTAYWCFLPTALAHPWLQARMCFCQQTVFSVQPISELTLCFAVCTSFLIQDLQSVLLQCGNEIWDNNVKLYLNNWIKGSPWKRTKVDVTLHHVANCEPIPWGQSFHSWQGLAASFQLLSSSAFCIQCFKMFGKYSLMEIEGVIINWTNLKN